MIRLRRGTILEILEERPGALELSVEVDGESGTAHAIAYPELVGPLARGDRVLLNTSAVALGLGTGGAHFVVAVEGGHGPAWSPRGRIMKLRYAPEQVNVQAVEEPSNRDRSTYEDAEARGLEGVPVVWLPLHSMLAAVAAGAIAGGASRIAYVMTDGAALPAGLSRLLAALRRGRLVEATVTTGQAFGGDLEAVSVFSGLLAARHVAGADVVVVGDGPGNTGTQTTWGATDVESAMSLNVAGILGGRPVAALRVSFVDARARHRGVSHHSITALSRVALLPVHVAVPGLEDEARRATIWAALTDAKLEERHQLVEVDGRPALEVLAGRGIAPESMGRTVTHDPEFWLAAGAAGVLAGRMVAADRAWRSPTQ